MHLYFYCFSDETIHVAGFCGKEFGFFLLARPLPRSKPNQIYIPHTILPLTYFIHLPMKMEPIVSSETSAIRTQTPGNYPKRNNLHLLLYLFPNKTQSSMNKLFARISCLPFTTLNPRFESHFHAGDNIYDTAPWGYNRPCWCQMWG